MAQVKLAALVAATLVDPGFMYALEKDVKSLVAAGDAEMNMNAANPNNPKEFAVRASEAGKAKQAALAATSPAAPTPTFTIETGEALAKPTRGGGRGSTYPFADFPAPTTNAEGKLVTARIFVPATEKMPDPAKSLSSTVSAASRQFATVTGTKKGKNRNGVEVDKNIYQFDRKFAIVAGEKKNADGTVTKGAYIERVK